jgi:nucleoside phosphorylase
MYVSTVATCWGTGVPWLTIRQVCNSVFGEVEFYDHAKTEEWNSTIIVRAYSQTTKTKEIRGGRLT